MSSGTLVERYNNPNDNQVGQRGHWLIKHFKHELNRQKIENSILYLIDIC